MEAPTVVFVPKPGYDYPCCAACAEHNAQGCPGTRSPFCNHNLGSSLDFAIRQAQDAIERIERGMEQLQSHAGVRSRDAGYHSKAAVRSLELVRGVIADCAAAERERQP